MSLTEPERERETETETETDRQTETGRDRQRLAPEIYRGKMTEKPGEGCPLRR